MDKLYAYINEGNVAFMKLRFRGVVTHSWLVIDIKKSLISDGYQLFTIDSNFPLATMRYFYHLGDTHFLLQNSPLFFDLDIAARSYLNVGDAFVPYLKKKREQQRLKEVLNDFCQNVSSF